MILQFKPQKIHVRTIVTIHFVDRIHEAIHYKKWIDVKSSKPHIIPPMAPGFLHIGARTLAMQQCQIAQRCCRMV